MATAHPGNRMTMPEMKAMMSCSHGKGGKSSKGKGKSEAKSPKR